MSKITCPIELDRYFFTRLSIIANPAYIRPPETETEHIAGPDNSLAVNAIEGQEGAFVVTQKVKMEASTQAHPYSVDVECVGFFHFTETMPPEEQQGGVTRVAHNVLYGACREAILAATSRQAWGPLSMGISVLQPTSPSNEQKEAAAE